MNKLSPANTSYLLEVGMEDLHQQSNTWLSEIEFWRLELSFYQKLLDKVTVRIPAGEDKKAIDHFQNLLLYYQGELLDRYEHDTRAHEKLLGSMVEEKAPFNEQLYREDHKRHESQLQTFATGFKQYRKELYAFAEKYI